MYQSSTNTFAQSAGTGTTFFNYTVANMQLLSGTKLNILDAANTDYVQQWHDGGNYIMKGTNTNGIWLQDMKLIMGTPTGSYGRDTLESKAFGYSAGYRGLMIGNDLATAATTQTLFFGVDPADITDGAAWSGTGIEYWFRRVSTFATPNAAGTGIEAFMDLNGHDITFHGYVTMDGGGDFQAYGSAGTVTEIIAGAYGTTNGGQLRLNGTTANKVAILKCTNGNLHIDADGTNATYLNYYGGSGGVYFGTGASSENAYMSPGGVLRSVGVCNTATAGLTLSGGTHTNGANIELYGESHATLANQGFIDAATLTVRSIAAATSLVVTTGTQITAYDPVVVVDPLWVYDTGATDYLKAMHDGTDFNFTTGNTRAIVFDSTAPIVVEDTHTAWVDGTLAAAKIHHHQNVGGGGHAQTGSTATGYCRIELPDGSLTDAPMFSMIIQGYNYSSTGGGWSILVGGHHDGTSWYNTNATIISGRPPFDTVSFGKATSNYYILLGAAGTTWNYPQIVIRDMMKGYSTAMDYIVDGVNFTVDFSVSTPAGWSLKQSYVLGGSFNWRTAGQNLGGNITISTSAASGGQNGDIHFKY
jgi:hypothetical protein